MNSATWNGEAIDFKVVYVKILAHPDKPYHWQNAFVGETRQAVYIRHKSGSFVIDNQDGSGLHKIRQGGGPGHYHANIAFSEYICDVPEPMWCIADEAHIANTEKQFDAWMRTNHPEKAKELKAVRLAFDLGLLHVNSRGEFAFGEQPKKD